MAHGDCFIPALKNKGQERVPSPAEERAQVGIQKQTSRVNVNTWQDVCHNLSLSLGRGPQAQPASSRPARLCNMRRDKKSSLSTCPFPAPLLLLDSLSLTGDALFICAVPSAAGVL